MTTLAGRSLTPGFVDGAGSNARFYYPTGIAFDGDKTLFIADFWFAKIRALDLTTNVVSTLAGGIRGNRDAVGTNAQFDEPTDVVYDSGALYVADRMSIRKIIVATGAVTTFAGQGGSTGSVDGVGSMARFSRPNGITSDGGGHLYVSDGSRIRRIDIGPDFGTVSTLAGGPASTANFRTPTGLTVAGRTLYIADRDNSLIREMNLDTREVKSPFGLPPHLGATNGAALGATFNFPRGFAVDERDTVYVSEYLNNDLRVITGGMVSLLAGAQAGLSGPHGIAYDGAGKLFVAQSSGRLRQVTVPAGVVTTPFDANPSIGVVKVGSSLFVTGYSNHAITRVDLASGGAVSIFAGNPAQNGAQDGIGTSARLTSPGALTTDGVDRIFVADSAGRTIRQITVSTAEVTTLAGAAGQAGYVDAIGAAARMTNISALAWDPRGGVYFAEWSNHTVRRLEPTTRAVTTYAGVVDRQVIQLGPLDQASLNTPSALAVLSDGTLLVGSYEEPCIVSVPLH